MGFKYINPGLVLNNDTAFVRSTSTTHTKTGHAFSTTKSYGSIYYLNLLTLDDYYDEIYGMFDIYTPALTGSSNISALATLYLGSTESDFPRTTIQITDGYSSKNKTRSLIYNSQSYITSSSARSISIAYDSTSTSFNKIHTIYFHLKNSILSIIYVDGVSKVNRVDETGTSTNSSTYCLYLNYNLIKFNVNQNLYISNLILSDSRITPNETMVEVPISSTSTNMTESSGVYTASSVGNYLLQTPNKSSLVSSYPNHRVTGISTVAQPAYTNGTPTTIAGRESSLKHDSTVLTTSNAAGALSSWKANLAMSQIDSKQYGWEVIA